MGATVTSPMLGQYSFNLGPVTIALTMDTVMSPKRQSKTEDIGVSENILNNLIIFLITCMNVENVLV